MVRLYMWRAMITIKLQGVICRLFVMGIRIFGTFVKTHHHFLSFKDHKLLTHVVVNFFVDYPLKEVKFAVYLDKRAVTEEGWALQEVGVLGDQVFDLPAVDLFYVSDNRGYFLVRRMITVDQEETEISLKRFSR